jgi:NADH-quinone oxidoreductase subunit F
MTEQHVKISSRNFDVPEAYRLPVALERGAYQALKKAVKMNQDDIVAEVRKSKLRGHGGAGFPAGVKWGFVPKDTGKPKYLCVNADESEPGTCKDRLILEKDPHLLLEGIIITCFAIGIHTAYVYIRGEYHYPTRIFNDAIQEAREARYIGKNILGTGFDLEVYTHPGAGMYICGEETGLIESLEGKKGWPRIKPPFPAVIGVFNCPTVVNNVETLSYVPAIIQHGGEWFLNLGTPTSGGTMLFSISGHVNKPGVYEYPVGTPLRTLIYDAAGGIPNDKKLKAVIPGGSSAPILTPDEIDVKMDFDAMMEIGSMLGSAGIIVMDQDTNMVDILFWMTRFYSHESCGQCTPCREGTAWLFSIASRIRQGRGRDGDLDLMLHLCDMIEGLTVCPLGAACAMPVRAIIKKFRPEFENAIKAQTEAVA